MLFTHYKSCYLLTPNHEYLLTFSKVIYSLSILTLTHYKYWYFNSLQVLIFVTHYKCYFVDYIRYLIYLIICYSIKTLLHQYCPFHLETLAGNLDNSIHILKRGLKNRANNAPKKTVKICIILSILNKIIFHNGYLYTMLPSYFYQ